jgi:hypothetical protein
MATFKTYRDFLTAVINANIGEDFTTYAQDAISKLDKKNADRKVSKSALAHKAENDNVKSAIVAFLSDGETKVASVVAPAIGVSTQKFSALAIQLVDEGVLTVTDVKVKGKGKVKGYALATPTADTDEDSEDFSEDVEGDSPFDAEDFEG